MKRVEQIFPRSNQNDSDDKMYKIVLLFLKQERHYYLIKNITMHVVPMKRSMTVTFGIIIYLVLVIVGGF